MFLVWHLYFKFNGSNSDDSAFSLMNQKQSYFDEYLLQLVSLVIDTGLGHSLMRHWSKSLSIWIAQTQFSVSFMNLSALHKSSCLEKHEQSKYKNYLAILYNFFSHKNTTPSHKVNSHCCSFTPRISFSIGISG